MAMILRWIFNAVSSFNSKRQKYYQNKYRFNGVYSRNNLPNNIKDGVYVINIDECIDLETRWIALYMLNDDIKYFESFELFLVHFWKDYEIYKW